MHWVKNMKITRNYLTIFYYGSKRVRSGLNVLCGFECIHKTNCFTFVKMFHHSAFNSQGFIESGDLRRHVRKHSKPSQPLASTEHVQQPEGEGLRVPCPLCHLTFGCPGDLAIHSSVHQSAPGRCVCRHCSKEFHSKSVFLHLFL